MGNEWRDVILNDLVVSVNTGLDAIRRAPIVNYETDVKCLRIQDITNNKPLNQWGNTDVNPVDFEKYRLRAGEIIMARTCSTGACLLINKDMKAVFNNGLARVRLNSELVDSAYIYYIFKSRQFVNYISGISCGTSVQLNMKVGDLVKFQLKLPPLSEQRAIAHILGTLDDKIELNRQMNETLEAMARALFKSWFVDFDPVRARMSSRKPLLSNDFGALFPDRLNEYGIPEGWGQSTLAELASLNPESWSKKNPPSFIEYVDLANTKWGVIESLPNIPWVEAPSRAQRILRYGDTIVGVVRPGNGSYAFIGRDGLTASTGFAVLRPKSDALQEFIFLAATSKNNIDRLTHLADGAAYPAVRPEVILATQIIVPGSKLRDVVFDAFSKLTKVLLDSIELNNRNSSILSNMRDALLPKLISGELRIKDAGQFIGRVL